MALAARHRGQSAFFLATLMDQNPVLAAYGFKCLIRTTKLARADVPLAAMSRTDLIGEKWSDLVMEKTLGEFFEEYFRILEAVDQ